MRKSQEFYLRTCKSDYFHLGRRSGTRCCLVSPSSFRPTAYRARVRNFQGRRRSTVYDQDDIQVCEDSFDCIICSTTIEYSQWLYSKCQQSFAKLVRTHFVKWEILRRKLMKTMMMIATKTAALCQNRSILNKRSVLMKIIGCFGTRIKNWS